jgi:hypothetical protein
VIPLKWDSVWVKIKGETLQISYKFLRTFNKILGGGNLLPYGKEQIKTD